MPSLASCFMTMRSGFGVILGKGVKGFQHGDFCAKTAKGLRHFHADGAAANDNEVSGQFF